MAKEVGWTIEYASLREAALMCRDAIVFTPPFVDGGGKGETKQAELVGKAAVKRDINSIFVAQNDKSRVTGSMHLKSLQYNAGTRNFANFTKARSAARLSGIDFVSGILNKIVKDSDDQRAFAKATNYFGASSVKQDYEVVQDLEPIHRRLKITNRQGKTKIIKNQGAYGTNKFLVQSKTQLNAYIKKEQEQVGKLKSGWWNAMQSLPKPKKKGVDQTFGRKGVAAYVKKFSGNVIKSVKTSPTAVDIRVGNLIGDNDNKATNNNVLQLVYGNAVQRIELDLERFLQRDVRNFNSGQIR